MFPPFFAFLGYLYDKTENYNATFYLAGSAQLLTAVLSLTAWLLVRRRRNGRGQRSYDVTSESWKASSNCVPSTQDDVIIIGYVMGFSH